MTSTNRRLFAVGGAIGMSALMVGRASAQAETPGGLSAELTDFLAALVATVPEDPDGKNALISVLGAGGLSQITEEVRTSAVNYLSTWQSNVGSLDSSSIPPHAVKFHDELASDMDFMARLIENAELADIADTMAFSKIGMYAMLLGEADAST